MLEGLEGLSSRVKAEDSVIIAFSGIAICEKWGEDRPAWARTEQQHLSLALAGVVTPDKDGRFPASNYAGTNERIFAEEINCYVSMLDEHGALVILAVDSFSGGDALGHQRSCAKSRYGVLFPKSKDPLSGVAPGAERFRKFDVKSDFAGRRERRSGAFGSSTSSILISEAAGSDNSACSDFAICSVSFACGQAGETRAKGPQRALDGEIYQGQTAARRLDAAGRFRHSGVRLQEPHLHRPGTRADPQVDGDRRRCP
jgi:hypothetical protein